MTRGHKRESSNMSAFFVFWQLDGCCLQMGDVVYKSMHDSEELFEIVCASLCCRLDAERKAHEMAVLVADLQRMGAHTARDAVCSTSGHGGILQTIQIGQ